MATSDIDDWDIVMAAANVALRAGALRFEVAPAQVADAWYSSCSMLSVGPTDTASSAAVLLARALLEGGLCCGCGRTVTTLAEDEINPRAPVCRWERVEQEWLPCGHVLAHVEPRRP